MFAAVIAVIILLREVLLPFVAGMVLAYLLNPLANRIERLGVNRLLATLAILLLIVVAITLLIVLVVPVLIREISYFIESVPLYVRRLHELTTDPDRPWLSKVIGEGLGEAEHSIDKFMTLPSNWFDTFLTSVWSGGRALISIFSLAIVAPIVACYLLYGWNKMIAAIDNWVPPARRETVRSLAREVDDTVGGFVRGQGAVCFILAIFYAATLWLIGLKHGALIGFSAGLLNFIPYLGSLSGLLIATCVAIAQFWPNWTSILLVSAIFLIGQSLSDYVLSPYLIGRSVHLNPVWLLFALFAFGYLFGFVGLLIAVPLAAAIGVLTRHALQEYYKSPLYAPAAIAPETDEFAAFSVNRQASHRSDVMHPNR